jgi:hypothetical protein
MAAEQAHPGLAPAAIGAVDMGGQAALPAGHLQVYDPGRPQEAFAYRDNKGRVSLLDPEGQQHMVPEEEAQAHVDKGWRPLDVQDHFERKERQRIEGSAGQAALGGFVSGVTGGVSDVMLEEYYGGAAARAEGELRAASPVAAGAGELAGFAAGLLGPGALARAASGGAGARAAAQAAQRAGSVQNALRAIKQDIPGQLAAFGKTRGKLARPLTRAERTAANLAREQEAWKAAKQATRQRPADVMAEEAVQRSLDVDWDAAARAARPAPRAAGPDPFAQRPRTAADVAAEEARLKYALEHGEAHSVAAALAKPGGRVERAIFRELAAHPRTTLRELSTRVGMPPEQYLATKTGALRRRMRPVVPSDVPAYQPSSAAEAAASAALRRQITVQAGKVPPRQNVVQQLTSDLVPAPPAAGPSFYPTPRPVAPTFAPPAAPPTAGAMMRGSVLRGLGEGTAYAASRELSRQALEGGDYDVGAIAAEGLQGAAIGGAVSLAGAGLAGIAGKAAKGLRQAVQRRAGTDTIRLDALLARQRAVTDRIAFTAKGPQRQALAREARVLKEHIFSERRQVFAAAGNLLNRVRLPLGIAPLTYGFNLQNLLLGFVSQGAGAILRSRLIAKAGLGAASGIGRVARTAHPMGAGMTKLAIVDSLTDDDLEHLAAQLAVTDAEEVGLAAQQGYMMAGIDEAMAGYLADFQRKRVEMLQQVVARRPDSTGRLVASRVYNAVEDPRRMAARLASGEVWMEDLVVLQYLFPDIYADLASQAKALLTRPGITTRQRLDLMKIAGDGQHGALVQSMQQLLVRQPQGGQGGRRYNPARDVATESQRVQGDST